MINFNIKKAHTGEQYLETALKGKLLLSIPQLNKGTAFTEQERHAFGLTGKLPCRVENLQEQTERAYQQYKHYDNPSNRNTYLNRLLDTNQTLFYQLVKQYISEMLPTLYTPNVGTTVTAFNHRFMTPRGLYISHNDENHIEEILDNRTNSEVKLIVVSDGEGVLGIGDQGVGAMAIPVAKLMVYTIFGGINPNHTLPIMLDAGTNNEKLLNDPLYLGLRKPRIEGQAYTRFIDKFIHAVKKKLPNVFLHWEDFGRNNALRNLVTYRDQLCTFNDDIQGTGIVALAAILAAGKITQTELKHQRLVIYGAGTAGMGVTEAIYQGLLQAGLTEEAARKKFWIIDRYGLITESSEGVTPAQRAFMRSKTDISDWNVNDPQNISLLETVRAVKPTILIGTSAQAGAFTKEIITEMARHTRRPLILPLSNPNERTEAKPDNIIEWTHGQALIATGSPFSDVLYQQKQYQISQCNNFLAFPGLGLGITAVAATHLSQGMLNSASAALAKFSHEKSTSVLPSIAQVEAASKAIAIAVAKKAIQEGHSKIETSSDIEAIITENFWQPHYLPYRRPSNITETEPF